MSRRPANAALTHATACSRNIAKPLQLFLDLLFRLGAVDVGQFLLEHVRDKLVDRRLAGEIGVAFGLRQKCLVQFDAGSEHV